MSHAEQSIEIGVDEKGIVSGMRSSVRKSHVQEYHLALAGATRPLLRGLIAIILLVGGLLAFLLAFRMVGASIESALGQGVDRAGRPVHSAIDQVAALLPIALLMPWTMLVQRWVYGVRGSTLHSVRSIFRIDVFGAAILAVVPIWAVYAALLTALSPFQQTTWAAPDILLLAAVTIVLAPLQSAGEEYGFRGLVFRIAASLGRGPVSALVLGALVSAALFAILHASPYPWLNLYFVAFGIALALIAWRSGGLEIPVVVHAVNNTLVFIMALTVHVDLAEGLRRSLAVDSPVMLIPVALLIGLVVVVWRRTHRTGPIVASGT